VSLKLAKTTVATVATLAVATVGFASLPISTHASGFVADGLRAVSEITPQGWGFFTRDPRSPITQARLRSVEGKWETVTRGPNATLRNAFGFNRSSRLDEYDVSQITGSRNIDELWSDCTGYSIEECAQRAESRRGVQEWTAEGYDLRLCGEVLLLAADPVPIDFAGLQYDASTKAIRATVRCDALEDR
jgi:antimicrobial peptide system SdpA family protein